MYNILFWLRNKCTLYKINIRRTLQKGLDLANFNIHDSQF